MIGQFEKTRDLHEDDDEGGFLRVSLGAHTSPSPANTASRSRLGTYTKSISLDLGRRRRMGVEGDVECTAVLLLRALAGARE